ncbi:glycine oxidase ThiO [Niveispirillum fermenti]|uniref:glycine oxidase ThiO n=1 Tax=Niveispirillum fermenti TaxID=1233113 RepID=UPI003A854319
MTIIQSKDGQSKDRPRVAIIGGGIIGMAIGWRLAGAGASVDIFERDRAGQGATRAAAGMLAAGVETEPGEQPLLPLCLESQARWPGFARELEAVTGLPAGLRSEGTLVVASTRDEVELLRSNYAFQRGLGLELSWLTGAEAKEKEPFLNPRTAAGVFSPRDGQVDNRLAAAALRAALAATGARLHEGTAVTGLDVSAGRVTGVVLGDRVAGADIVVLAAGAWSRLLPGQPVPPPVRPVKGQMMSLAMDPARPLLTHVVWAPKCYLVPRRDGTLIIGATTEEKGFDSQMTAGGVLALLDAAWRALPGVEELPVREMWTGLRPGSRDDAPILGPAPGLEGLVLATGHHRNGILLAPVTADAITDLILTGRVDTHIRPFGAERFAAAQAA